MTVVFLGTLCLTLQCMIFSLIAERYPEAWKLRSGIEIAAVVCMAIVGNVVTAYVDTWCLRKRDPIYVAMFRPLGIAIVVVMTVIFLGTLFTLEVIVAGFYALMRGQVKENCALRDKSNIP
ncbi:WAT1-related protein At3g28050-like isoform X2 [Punica granatum]|uniref:WAT1-related protein At3g28050-like isoform X2 n=1 Tax=Punica granatum TaxID=22663 RepID=A0A6P8CUG8_PUNGR|nr:WAT1-related protein At3g28050-like isoform X2 [Punica granatum]